MSKLNSDALKAAVEAAWIPWEGSGVLGDILEAGISAYLAALPKQERSDVMSVPAAIAHGWNCPKAAHVGAGYIHAEDDDKPYDMDGVMYCGRCHRAMDTPK